MLGPVAVHAGGSLVNLGRRRERLLLAVLALEPGRVIPAERLVNLLWPQDAPDGAHRHLHVHVSRLRKQLRDAGADGLQVNSHPGGYLVQADPRCIDAHVFRDLVERARGQQPGAASARLLRQALEMWRGPALFGVTTEDQRQRLVSGLEELRLGAYELLSATELALGNAEQVVADLVELVQLHPTREPLIANLLTALHALGRTPEALDLYRRTHLRMVEELGVEPGTELRRAHETMLSQAETPPPTIAQLPARTGGFAGREAEMSNLDDLLGGRASVIAVTGGPGMGKSAIAVEWAHRIADRFPDGQLFANLNGFDPAGPGRPLDAVCFFLRSLGIAPAAVPSDLEAAAAMFRSTLAVRRMLIVLDNVASAEHARPLLPGAEGSLVVVTSRDALTGLVAREGARRLTLGPLSTSDALELLAGTIDTERVAADPDAIVDLAVACGHLPLAIRIVSANISGQPGRSIANYLAALTLGETLEALEVVNDPTTSVRRAFDESYAALTPQAQRLFCLMGILPGTNFGEDTIAAAAGLGIAEARRTLDSLCGAHMSGLTWPGPRYEMHDLLRLYARERMDKGEGVLSRVYEHYLSRLDAAAGLLYPQMLRLPSRPPAADVFGGDAASAAAWLDAEHTSLVAAVGQACAEGFPAIACHLADALRGQLWLRRNMNDWFRVARQALATAEAADDRYAMVAAMISIAHAQHCAAEYEDAAETYDRALTLAGELCWLEAQGTALGNLAVIHLGSGRIDRSIALCRQSIAVYRMLGNRSGEAVNVGNLGLAYRLAGRLGDAKAELEAAATMHRAAGTQSMLVMSLSHLGDTYRQLGDREHARGLLLEALEMAQRIGHRAAEAVATEYQARLLLDLGELGEAGEHAERALRICQETGNTFSTAYSLVCLGEIAERKSLQREAVSRYTEALQIARKAAERHPETEALIGLARVSSPPEARAHAIAALDLALQYGHQLNAGKAQSVLDNVAQSVLDSLPRETGRAGPTSPAPPDAEG